MSEHITLDGVSYELCHEIRDDDSGTGTWWERDVPICPGCALPLLRGGVHASEAPWYGHVVACQSCGAEYPVVSQ